MLSSEPTPANEVKQVSAPEGNKNFLNIQLLFEGKNEYGIPHIPRQIKHPLPMVLIPYRRQLKSLETHDPDKNCIGVHFFQEDRVFEPVWSRPANAWRYLQKFGIACTPDFSLYSDWPRAIQIWNVYRSRWCGCYWQSRDPDMIVYPTIGWSSSDSFEFSFLGVEQGSVVAVSGIGVNFNDTFQRLIFMEGFKEMVFRVDPEVVLSSGALPDECHSLVRVKTYNTRWQDVRVAMKEQSARQNGTGS